MKENIRAMLLILLQSEKSLSAQTLSSELEVSIRTIKNYVKEINSCGKKIIVSNKLGYQILLKKEARKYLIQDREGIPQTFKERSEYIIKKKLIQKEEMNVFDLCQELFISYSTLKSDVQKMNEQYRQYRINLYTKNNYLEINGAEKDKRVLISNIIFNENTHQFLDVAMLKNFFQANDVEQLNQVLKHFLAENNLTSNDFSYVNLILHLLILIERVRGGETIQSHIVTDTIGKNNIDITPLILDLESKFGLSLSKLECQEVEVLVTNTVNINYRLPDAKLQRIIPESHQKLITQVLQEVKETYGITLNHSSFLIPFSLHINSLLYRLTTEKSIRNPLLGVIKKSIPIIYDIAVYISLRIKEKRDLVISEDEVAFIAIHIGAELDRQKNNDRKVKIVLFCPDYLNLADKIVKMMEKLFSDDMTIVGILSDEETLMKQEYDLVLSIIDLPSIHTNVFYIEPFNIENQKQKIYHAIELVRLQKNNQLFLEEFDHYFDPSVFVVSSIQQTREEVVELLCEKMVKRKYVDDSFAQSIWEREAASPTSFGEIAIPHSVKMDAFHSNVGVYINKKGIIWGEDRVFLVLLIATNELDRKKFFMVYETLINIVDEENNLNLIKEISDFASFKDFMFDRLDI